MTSSVIITIVVVLGIIVAGGFLLYFIGDLLMSLSNKGKDNEAVKNAQLKKQKELESRVKALENNQGKEGSTTILYNGAVVESYNPEEEENKEVDNAVEEPVNVEENTASEEVEEKTEENAEESNETEDTPSENVEETEETTEEEQAEEEAETKARDILALAMSKYSQEVTCERTVSVVSLPSDEMKGRIIGREGRNIKSLESLLGVDIIIDDTPEVLTISCFDPIRRETARMTLDALIKDGRIQPGRIEELYAKCKAEMDSIIKKAGEDAVNRLGLPRIHRELIQYIGRLKFRTSYGQNVLEHSIQVAYLCGIMAAELGLDQNMAKRAGLLHDIGKAADFELEGSHVEVGARLAKKYGEPDVVINAIESHHGDKPAKYVISTLVVAADTLSAARPGARSETLENYIKRIEDLETICKGFDGVSNCFAMQSGREVRVAVIPEKIDDAASYKLARDIRDKIQNEMTYPGQVKVSVIRELRAVEIAK